MFIRTELMGSLTIIVLKCDYCGIEFTKKSRLSLIQKQFHFHDKACVDFASRLDGILYTKKCETYRNKTGIENPFQDPKIKQQIVNINLTKLGVAYPMQSEIVKEKSRVTCLKKYGAENVAKSQHFLTKSRESSIARYGVSNPMQAIEVKSKLDYREISRKGHETKKKTGSYRRSKPEILCESVLKDIFGAENVILGKQVQQWPIDFYITTIDTYVQIDGEFWHGHMCLPREETQLFSVIKQNIQRDIIQNEWFKNHNLKLERFIVRGKFVKNLEELFRKWIGEKWILPVQIL